jgi:hypothetical protein
MIIMNKIINQIGSFLAAVGLTLALLIAPLASAQIYGGGSSGTSGGGTSAPTSGTSTPSGGTSAGTSATSGTTSQTPSGGVRAGGAGMVNLGDIVLILGLIVAGGGTLVLRRMENRA